jgi:tRNA(Arg) A34 adenosine deaminase TadA
VSSPESAISAKPFPPHQDFYLAKSVEALRRDLEFYNKALEVARSSNYSTKVGCVASKSTRIICSAANKLTNPSLNVPIGEATKHAEMAVLTMLTEYAKVTLYIARPGRVVDLPSRPCIKCMWEIKNAGIREIVYLSKNGRVVKEMW